MLARISKDVGQVVDIVLREDRIDEHHLVKEDMKVFAKEAILEVLMDQKYEQNLVEKWTDSILANSIEKLHSLEKSFKFIVICTILEKLGGDLHCVSDTHWNGVTDEQVMVRYENETIACIVNVLGFKI